MSVAGVEEENTAIRLNRNAIEQVSLKLSR